MAEKQIKVNTQDQSMLYVMFLDLMKSLDGNYEAFVSTQMIVDKLQSLEVLEKTTYGQPTTKAF